MQHWITALGRKIAYIRQPQIKNSLIRTFVHYYGVNLEEAVYTHPQDYAHFNAFFTRKLKITARPISAADLISPVDGALQAIGPIDNHTLYQAKGQTYTTLDLLVDPDVVSPISSGQYLCIYLAPKDYHHIHMPTDGQLLSMRHETGALYSVNPQNAARVPKLFAQNERLITVFKTQWGHMVIVFVGALIVGGIYTQWHGLVTPPHGLPHRTWHYDSPDHPLQFKKSQDIGHFELGSTVVVLFSPGHPPLRTDLKPEDALKMGEGLSQTSLKTDILNIPPPPPYPD
jgi:phosphatidylserine decarboxylase